MFQVVCVKVRDPRSAVAIVASRPDKVTVTSCEGCVPSQTSYVAAAPSVTVSDLGDRFTPGASSSSSVMTATLTTSDLLWVVAVPCTTTVSSSSALESSVGVSVSVTVFAPFVSPTGNVMTGVDGDQDEV